MVDQWYFSWDDNEFGPFFAAQLKEMAALGRLQPTDTVWKQGSERKVRADRINNLFPDPKTNAVLAKVTPAFSASLQPSENHSASIPNSGAKLQPWLPLAREQGTPGEQEAIPEGLLLRAIAELDDSEPPASPPICPSSPEQSAEPSPKTTPARVKGRARAVSGAIITSQDGEVARYRKQCSKCGHKESSNTVMLIRHGLTRVTFFCPKCKKIREAIIEGIR
jgi:hypothetical protein